MPDDYGVEQFMSEISQTKKSPPVKPKPAPKQADPYGIEDFMSQQPQGSQSSPQPGRPKPLPRSTPAATQPPASPVLRQDAGRPASVFDRLDPQGVPGPIFERSPEQEVRLKRIEAKNREYERKGFFGQLAEDVPAGAARFGEGVQRAGQKLMNYAGYVTAGVPLPEDTAGSPTAAGRAAQAYTANKLGEQEAAQPGGALAREVTQGLMSVPVYAAADLAGGIPVVAGLNAAQQDWSNPGRAVLNTVINTAVPIGAGRAAGRIAQPLLREAAPLVQVPGRIATEAAGGAAGNVGTALLMGETNPEALQRSAISGAVVGGVTGVRRPTPLERPAPLDYPQMNRPAAPRPTEVIKLEDLQAGRQRAVPTVMDDATFEAELTRLSDPAGSPEDRAAAIENLRAQPQFRAQAVEVKSAAAADRAEILESLPEDLGRALMMEYTPIPGLGGPNVGQAGPAIAPQTNPELARGMYGARPRPAPLERAAASQGPPSAGEPGPAITPETNPELARGMYASRPKPLPKAEEQASQPMEATRPRPSRRAQPETASRESFETAGELRRGAETRPAPAEAPVPETPARPRPLERAAVPRQLEAGQPGPGIATRGQVSPERQGARSPVRQEPAPIARRQPPAEPEPIRTYDVSEAPPDERAAIQREIDEQAKAAGAQVLGERRNQRQASPPEQRQLKPAPAQSRPQPLERPAAQSTEPARNLVRPSRPTERRPVPLATDRNIEQLQKRLDTLSRMEYERRGEMNPDLRDELSELRSAVIEYDKQVNPDRPGLERMERARADAMREREQPGDAQRAREEFGRLENERMRESTSRPVSVEPPLGRESETEPIDEPGLPGALEEQGRNLKSLSPEQLDKLIKDLETLRNDDITGKREMGREEQQAASRLRNAANEERKARVSQRQMAPKYPKPANAPPRLKKKELAEAMKDQREQTPAPEASAEPTAQAQPETAGRTIQHSRMGQVTEASDQTGVARGKLRVIDSDGNPRIIQNPRTRGNREAAFVREEKSATSTPAPETRPQPSKMSEGVLVKGEVPAALESGEFKTGDKVTLKSGRMQVDGWLEGFTREGKARVRDDAGEIVTVPKERLQRRETPETPRTATQALKSAGKETLQGLDKAAKGLSALFGGPKLSAGFTFDEKTYAQAKPHFQEAYNHFKSAGREIGNVGKRLTAALKNQYGFPDAVLQKMRPYIKRFVQDQFKDVSAVRDQAIPGLAKEFRIADRELRRISDQVEKLDERFPDQSGPEYERAVQPLNDRANKMIADLLPRIESQKKRYDAQLKNLGDRVEELESRLEFPDIYPDQAKLRNQLKAAQGRYDRVEKIADSLESYQLGLREQIGFSSNPEIARLSEQLNQFESQRSSAIPEQKQVLRKRIEDLSVQLETAQEQARDDALSKFTGAKPRFILDAEQRLAEVASGKRAGSGGQALVDQALVAGYKAYRAGMQFREWASQVIKEAGEGVRPHLREAWEKISGSFSVGELPRTREQVENSPQFKRFFRNSKVVDEKGKPLIVYHGSPADFDVFSRSMDAGFHFGTPKAATDILKAKGSADLSQSSIFGDEYVAPELTSQLRKAGYDIPDFENFGDLDGYIRDLQRKLGRGEATKIDDITWKAQSAAEAKARETGGDLKAGSRIMPVYLRLERPFRMEDVTLGSMFSGRDDYIEHLRDRGILTAKEANELIDLSPITEDEKTQSREMLRDAFERAGYDGIIYENKLEDKGSTSYVVFRPEQIKSAIGNSGEFSSSNPSIMGSGFGSLQGLFEKGQKPPKKAGQPAQPAAAGAGKASSYKPSLLEEARAKKAMKQGQTQSAQQYFDSLINPAPGKAAPSAVTARGLEIARKALQETADKVQRGNLSDPQKQAVIQAADDLMTAARLGDRDAIKTARTALEKAQASKNPVVKTLKAGQEGLKTSRTLVFGSDLSFPLRQALPLTAPPQNWGQVAKAGKSMWDSLWSERGAEGVRKMFDSHPYMDLADKSGLELTHFGEAEEVYGSKTAEKIPGWGRIIKRTEAANNAYLDHIRLESFAKMAKSIERNSKLDAAGKQRGFKAAAEAINTLTGKTDIGEGAVAAAVKGLQGVMTAPRLNLSRMQLLNPVKYAQLAKENPMVARQTALMVGETLGGIALLGYAAALTGKASFTLNPDDPDFGKIVVGRTRYDLSGGILPVLKTGLAYGKLGKGLAKTAVSNSKRNEKELESARQEAWSKTKTFVRGRLAPIPSLSLDIGTGKDLAGKPVTAKELKSLNPAENPLVRPFKPAIGSDLLEGFQNEGWAGVAKTLPSFVGAGATTMSAADERKRRQRMRERKQREM